MIPTDTISIAEAGEVCGIKSHTVRSWITYGVRVGSGRVKLAAIRIGGRFRIPRSELEAFISACNPGEKIRELTPSEYRRNAEADRDELAARLGVSS